MVVSAAGGRLPFGSGNMLITGSGAVCLQSGHLVRISNINVTDAPGVKSVNSNGILSHLHAGDTGDRPLPGKPQRAAKRAEIPQLSGHYR